MIEIAKKTAALSDSNYDKSGKHIPSIIHQTFETYNVPNGMYDAAQSWIRLNPGFEHRFYDAHSRRSFIEKEYHPKVLLAYDKLTHGAFQADLWRYCQLYVDGGIYSDLDQVCIMPMSTLLEPDDTFVSARAGNLPFAIYNGFICSKPQHPFLKEAIDRAVDLIIDNDAIDGYITTGPWNLGVSINKCLSRSLKSDHVIGISGTGDLRLKLLEKHPKTPDAPGYLSLEREVVLLTEYEGYKKDLSSTGVNHWQNVRPDFSILTRIKRKLKDLKLSIFGKT
jgi:hypothetical protein